MSAIGPVVDNYEAAVKAEEESNFLLAARLYRMCALFYENGELPFFMSQVKEYGEDAPAAYFRCRRKLTEEAQRMLGREHRKYSSGGYLISNWREYVEENWQHIVDEQNRPSPNKSD